MKTRNGLLPFYIQNRHTQYPDFLFVSHHLWLLNNYQQSAYGGYKSAGIQSTLGRVLEENI